MQKNRRSVLFLAQAAVIAALYAGLSYVTPEFLKFGNVQFRVSEALTLLPVLTPAAIPGLTIGCVLTNLSSPDLGVLDIAFGSLATLLAALCTYWLRKITVKGWPVLAAIPPVLFNAVIISAMLWHVLRFPFWLSAGQIALSQFVICFGLGLPLVALLKKTPIIP